MANSEKSRTSAPSAKSTRRSAPSRAENSVESANAETATNWTEGFVRGADTLETEARTLIRKYPAYVLGGAIGVGILGSILLKKFGSSSLSSTAGKGKQRRGGATSAPVESGALSQALSPALDQVRKEFDRIAFDGIGSVKQQLTTIARDQLETNPVSTIGSLIAFGYGVAGLDRDQFRQAFIHAAKLLAMKSIDGGVTRASQKALPDSEAGEEEDESIPSTQKTQKKGDTNANDESQFH